MQQGDNWMDEFVIRTLYLLLTSLAFVFSFAYGLKGILNGNENAKWKLLGASIALVLMMIVIMG